MNGFAPTGRINLVRQVEAPGHFSAGAIDLKHYRAHAGVFERNTEVLPDPVVAGHTGIGPQHPELVHERALDRDDGHALDHFIRVRRERLGADRWRVQQQRFTVGAHRTRDAETLGQRSDDDLRLARRDHQRHVEQSLS